MSSGTEQLSREQCLPFPAETVADAVKRNGSKLGDTACELSPPQLQGSKATQAAPALKTINSLLTGTGTDDTHQPAVSGSQKCKLLSAHSTNGFGNTDQPASPISVAGGYIEIPVTQAGVTLKSPAELKRQGQPKTKPWHEATTKAEKMETASSAGVANETGVLSGRATLRAVIAAMLPKAERADEQKITDKIKAIFDGLDSKQLQQAEEAVDNDKIPKDMTDDEADRRLGDLSDLTQLVTILSRYEAKMTHDLAKLKDKLNTESKQQGSKPEIEDKQKECGKNHASQYDCDSKDFCTYDKTKDEGKRRVYNETKAKEKGVTVTQTQT
uniref:Variant surface glycoprotein 1125.2796 n=1 Tax=Trypanosoma brucei TaxID=5691 RepID=A0A1J0R913_9TRYP|nr:variant surface glycoprotein 1125.2796 [Trypanosoma brucei]